MLAGRHLPQGWHSQVQEGQPVRVRHGLDRGGQPQGFNANRTFNRLLRTGRINHNFDDGTSDCTLLASAAVVAHLPPEIPRQALGDQTLRGMGIFEVYRLGPAAVPSVSASTAAPIAS